MGRGTPAILGSVILLCIGCDLRMMDPRWNALAKKGVATVPGEYRSASYIHGVTDAQFAAAVPDLKKVRIRELNFQQTQLTDDSIEGLLVLRDLERLILQRTDFTAAGLTRLSALPRLKKLYVPEGQFTDAELSGVRAALPGVELEESILGSRRYAATSAAAASRPAE